MNKFLELSEHAGLYKTVLPVFGKQSWRNIVAPTGFVWIGTPFVDLSGQLDSIIGSLLFGTADLDLRCSVHRVELDVSIPTIDFLRFVDTTFPHGLDFIWSEKHQPSGFKLNSITKANWPSVMTKNQIWLTFHRPGGGEPSLVTSNNRSIVASIIERFSAQEDE